MGWHEISLAAVQSNSDGGAYPPPWVLFGWRTQHRATVDTGFILVVGAKWISCEIHEESGYRIGGIPTLAYKGSGSDGSTGE